MKENLIKNIKGNSLTTSTGVGTGIAVALISVLKLFKIDLGELAGVDSEYVLLGISSLVSALVNLIARDPKKDGPTPE